VPEIEDLKAWCNEGRRLLSLRGKDSRGKLESRNQAVAALLERLKAIPELKAQYDQLFARYQQLATAASSMANDDASAHLSEETRRSGVADVSRNLSILKSQVRQVLAANAKEEQKAGEKIGAKLAQAAGEYRQRAESLAKNPRMPFAERRAVLNQISQDLTVLAQEAIRQGQPGTAVQLAKQIQATLSHPSAFPPADDLPSDPARGQKAGFERQQQERGRILQDRRKSLQDTVATLRQALAQIPAEAPERAEVAQALARAEEDLKFARVDTKDSYRAALTQATFRQGMLKVETRINQLGLDATGDGSLMEKIATKLDRVIDEMVSEAVLKYMEQTDSLRNSYSGEMSKLIQNPQALFQTFPGLKPMIDAEVERFTHNVNEVLDSTAKDKQEIASAFFGGKNLKGLKNFVVADSDPHNGGRKVTILEFEAADGTVHKVVNKPRDVRVDAKFVGGMEPTPEEKQRLLKEKRAAERFRRIKEEFGRLFKPGAFKDEQLASMTDEDLASLASWDRAAQERLTYLTVQVNQDIPELRPEDIPGHVQGGSLLEVATALIRRKAKLRELQKARDAERSKRIFAEFPPNWFNKEDLPSMTDEQLAGLLWDLGAKERLRNLSDQVAEDIQEKDIPDPDIPPLPTYKFLPKQPANGQGHPYGWVEFVEHGSAKDAVVSEEQAKKFYRQAGRQAALAMLFGIEDLHQGNMMVSNGQPQLTDLEIAFSPKVFQYFPAEFEKFKEDKSVEVGSGATATMMDAALVKGDQTAHYGNAMVSDDRIAARRSESGNAATDNYLAVAGPDGSLKTNLEGLARDFGPQMQEGLEEILEAFADPKLAGELTKFVESFQGIHVRYHAKATANQLGVRRAQLEQGYADPHQPEVDTAVSSWVKSNPAIAPLQAVMADDLKKRDVAYFTRELGGGDVCHNGTTPIKRQDGDDFFDDDGLEGVRRQFAILRDPDGLEYFKKCAQSFVGVVSYQAMNDSQTEANAETKERLRSELDKNAAAQGV